MAGVRIPIIGQDTSVPVSSPTPHASAMPVDNTMGKALMDASQAITHVTHAVSWQNEQDAKAWTTNALPDITLKAQEEFQKRKESAREGATNFTPEYVAWFDDFQKQALANAPDDASRKFLGQHMAHLRTSLTSSALSFEAGARQDWRANEYAKGVDKWAKVVAARPGDYDKALAALTQTMPDVGPEKKTALRDVAEKSLRIAAGSTAVLNDPRTTLQQVDAVLGTHSRKLTQQEASAAGVTADAMPLAIAIFGQESSGGKADTSKPNVDGALGPMQITEATWKTFQKRGVIPADWQWGDPKQNKEAGFKIVQYYADQYGGDVEKVAAAYFGGEGAINADGSIKRDRKDSNGKTVGSYVDDIKRRVSGGVTKLAAVDTGTMTDAGGGVKVAPAAPSTPSWMASMTVGELMQMRAQAEQQLQQVQTQQFADVSIGAARQAISTVDINPETYIDLPSAKEEAVRIATERNGSPLTEPQRLQVENYVEKIAADAERDKKRAMENGMVSAFDILDKNGGDYQALLRDRPELATKTSRENRERMQKYAGEVATGATLVTDWQSYTTLINDPATLKATNLDAIKDKLNVKEYTQLKKIQTELLTSSVAEDNIRSNLTVVKTMLTEAGVKDDKKESQFFSMLQQAIDQELAATGKKAITQQRTKELAADLLVQQITSKGILWDSKETAFMITVPPAERVKIEAALKENGLPISDYNVLRAYRNKLERQNKPPAKPSTTSQN